jgi:hypothetical protein
LTLIGDHYLWREGLLSQQLAHELDGRALVPPALNQHVEDLAFVVDSAPWTRRYPGALRATHPK